jgi:hypothetical protein
MTRLDPRGVLVPVAAAMVACGPAMPINAALKGQPANVLLGGSRPSPSAVAQLPNINPMATFPGFIQAPPPVIAAAPAPPPPSLSFSTPNPCPPADPHGAAQVALGNTPAGPPPDASYHFRQTGAVSFTKPSKGSVAVPSEVVRSIQSTPTSAAGTYTYQVTETASSVTQVTKFLVDPEGVNVGGLAQSKAAGLYITEVDGYAPEGNNQFTPDNPIELLGFPAASQVGTTFDVNGVDAVHQLSLRGTGTVVGPDRVDACGKVIYAYRVKLTAQLLGPSNDVNLAATYWIVPQYGAISVQDTIAWTTNPGNPTQYASQVTATINQLPAGGA